MWAGGSVRFRNPSKPLVLDGGPGVCVERIRDVQVKGPEGQEKIFVGIERRIGRAESNGHGVLREREEEVLDRIWREDKNEFGDAEVVERRNIVFMKERTKEEMKEVLRMVDAPRNLKVKKRNIYPLIISSAYEFAHLYHPFTIAFSILEITVLSPELVVQLYCISSLFPFSTEAFLSPSDSHHRKLYSDCSTTATITPTMSHTLVPTASLLFRYSALKPDLTPTGDWIKGPGRGGEG